MEREWPREVLESSRSFIRAPLPYVWSSREQRALKLFFSNTNSRVFFMQNVPPHVTATIFSMFSRLKNPRGIRGIFVDQFLPQLLASELAEVRNEFGGNEEAFLKARRIQSLDAFADYSRDAQDVTNMFLDGMRQDPRSLALLRQSEKAKRFLATWLDAYGHNSIARMATMWIGFEQISVLAVKSLAWARPGAAQIGLSFRYTDASDKDCYPIAEELAMLGADASRVRRTLELAFRRYRELRELFPEFLREYWGAHPYFAEHPNELEAGVRGETYDVLGNLLPACTLQAVGFSVSGEALPSIVKHLLLDHTPENIALAERILEEVAAIGGGQFLRHYEPTEWERLTWRYEEVERFRSLLTVCPPPCAILLGASLDSYSYSERVLASLADRVSRFPRGEHDKLPREFEMVTLPFRGVMSFRGWRDLQRQSLSTHLRTYLTTKLGFYHYDKPAPRELRRAFDELAAENRRLEAELEACAVSEALRQYPLALGNNVGFLMSSNLRQWEFCTWQRTKWSVNHEVRQVFRAIEQALRQRYPWWERVSRADITPAYIFARGKKGIPLSS